MSPDSAGLNQTIGRFLCIARDMANSLKDIALSLHHVRQKLENIDSTLAETRQVMEEK